MFHFDITFVLQILTTENNFLNFRYDEDVLQESLLM